MEVNTPRARVFLKVVRPVRVAELQRKHIALAEDLPVPNSHGWNAELGLVALQAMPGKPLRKAMETGTRKLPPAEQFLALLDAFPDAALDAEIVPGPADKAAFHAALLNKIMPESTDRIEAIVQSSAETVEDDPVHVHGDFHSSQLLVRGPDIVGLIDVDTAGVGRRSDDLAVLLSHMSTIGLSTAARRSIDQYGTVLTKHFDKAVDPATLRRKVAAAVLGLATGPFRANVVRWAAQTERRIALAERWVASAESIDG